MDTATAISRILGTNVGLVQPWNHHAVNEPEPCMTAPTEESVYLFQNDNDNFTSYLEGEESTPTNVPWWYTFVFMTLFFVIICCSFVLRDGISRWCGIDLCSGSLISHASQHPHADRPATEEELRQRQIEKQRQERRLWYSYFLKPYLVVLTAEHFMADGKKQSEDQHELEESSAEKGQVPIVATNETNSATEHNELQLQPSEAMVDPPTVPALKAKHAIDVDDVVDVDALQEEMYAEYASTLDEQCPTVDHSAKDSDEPAAVDADKEEVAGTDKAGQDKDSVIRDEESPVKMMTLWDPHDTTFRQIEANCSICLLDYEEGDTIVRSAANEEDEYCIHVFHYECMLAWLAQGKKRCPICRHWFVPAVRIKEQMKEAHIVTRPDSLHHLYDARTMQDIASLNEDTDMSSSYHSDDYVDIEQGRPTEAGVIFSRGAPLPPAPQTNHHHHHHEQRAQHARRHSHPAATSPAHHSSSNSQLPESHHTIIDLVSSTPNVASHLSVVGTRPFQFSHNRWT